ncbi:hypothetical protein [Actinoplanes sp. N902-109]|uniref:hypothetical protein n=1 Tax=Actinoplanes sp. (strain N902-109) TaxID=649831 RepID=UPI0003293EFD|nr:hypothetical protein [Actinoplanes sp. N902-109]AGL13844.1 hypothetical protein L083_0334 [Actinoplanes sp. N902-109]
MSRRARLTALALLLALAVGVIASAVVLLSERAYGAFVLIAPFALLATACIGWPAAGLIAQRRQRAAAAESREAADTDAWLIAMNGGRSPRVDSDL